MFGSSKKVDCDTLLTSEMLIDQIASKVGYGLFDSLDSPPKEPSYNDVVGRLNNRLRLIISHIENQQDATGVSRDDASPDPRHTIRQALNKMAQDARDSISATIQSGGLNAADLAEYRAILSGLIDLIDRVDAHDGGDSSYQIRGANAAPDAPRPFSLWHCWN